MANITDSITNINFLSQEQFNSITTPSNNELYAVEFTPKGFNLFDYKLSNYTLNDPRWLCANNFTWQYSKYIDENYQGYGVAYQHLLEDYNAETTLGAQSEIIAGTTVYFRLAADGHKIAPADQETALETIYNATGAADYFMLDITNERFKLPRKQKRQLVQSRNNGSSWYNLYSDGWVEQGGTSTSGQASPVTVSLPITMANGKYQIQLTPQITDNTIYDYTASRIATIRNSNNYTNSTTSFMYAVTSTTGASTVSVCWEVKGYAASVPAQTQLEYYYVGEYTIPALENTAGINTETLNNKVDRDFGNIPTGYDIVIDWQAPTAANNYTWYRKYKSGWIEQGGIIPTGISNVTFPIQMLDTNYSYTYSYLSKDNTSTMTWQQAGAQTISPTGMTFSNFSTVVRRWEVKGMAA